MEAQDYISDLLKKAENGETLDAQARAEGESEHSTHSALPTFEGDVPDPTQPRLNKNGDRRGANFLDGNSTGRPAWDARAYDGDTSKLHSARGDDIPQSFAGRYLNEKYEHRLIAYLRAEGYSCKEISERMGYSYTGVLQIVKLPWVKEVICEAIRAAGQDRVRALLASSAEDSVHCLIAVRDDPNSRNSDKISAARELLDRQYGRAAQLTVHATTHDLEQMSDADLTKIARGNISTN